MLSTFSEKTADIARLCKTHHVARLKVFGSAVTDRFDETASDLDFLVEFDEVGVRHYADCYFGLMEGLQTLFARPVDLVVISAIKNPYFKQRVEEERKLLYAA